MKKTHRLKIALQKKGRLFDDSIDLLKRCGLEIQLSHNGLFCHCKNLAIDLLLVRDDDIPTLVMEDICDVGIVGENVLKEKAFQQYNAKQNHSYIVAKKLGFGRCHLAIATAEKLDYQFPNSLRGKRIATSYPHLLTDFCQQHQIDANIVHLSGSVEIAPRLGIADFICDLVSSGQTLEANNLKEVTQVMTSQAVLIQSEKTFNDDKQAVFSLLLQRIEGVLQAKESKYILMHAPKSELATICQLLPGSETPTILPLQHNVDKVAVHMVSSEGFFWDTLEKLKKAGASSILVLPIEKMLT